MKGLLVIIGILCFVAILGVLGHNNNSPSSLEGQTITNTRGQSTTFVKVNEISKWLRDHSNLRLIALTGYSGGQYGTSGYVVVYETPQAERQ